MGRSSIALWLAILAGSASAFDVTTCGETVPAGDVGVLRADLVGCDYYAVELEDGATLQMNGHAILGSIVYSIYCTGRRCTMVGPGEVANGGSARGQGSVLHDYIGHGRTVMTVSDLDIHDNGLGIAGGLVYVSNVVVTRNRDGGIFAYRFKATNAQVIDNGGYGIFAGRDIRLVDSTITGNDGNGQGIDLTARRRPHLIDSTCGKSLGPSGGPFGVCTGD
jgi:hypothetical protein